MNSTLQYFAPSAWPARLLGGRLLQQRSYLQHLPSIWWQSLMIWPGAVMCIAVWVLNTRDVMRGLASAQEAFANPPLLIATATLVWLYLRVGFGHESYQIFDYGLRLESKRFSAWHDVHHYSQRGDGTIVLFHRLRCWVPAAVVRPDAPLIDELKQRLSDYQIPRNDDSSPRFALLCLAVVAVTAGLLAIGFYGVNIRAIQSPIARPVILYVFYWLLIVPTLVLEAVRGLYWMTKVKPADKERKVRLPWGAPAGPISETLIVKKSSDGQFGPIPPPSAVVLPTREFVLALMPRRPWTPPNAAAPAAPVPAVPIDPSVDLSALTDNTPWEVVTIRDARGRTLLPVFTTPAAIGQWMPAGGGSFLPIHGIEICRRVCAGAADGIVLNPGHTAATETPPAELGRLLPSVPSSGTPGEGDK
jgi:hypothetical protein